MSVFEAPEFDGHEKVVFFDEPDAGLKAIIAIHNTNLGPALGGCRMWPYETEAEAIRDVLRLSRGMTYKAAMVGARLGGGKSVIIADSRSGKTRDILHAMGRAIDSLNEGYIVGEDIGTNPDDMREIRTQTRCVSCLRIEDGGYGDPAPMTALGVFSAMRAGIEHALGTSEFKGLRVAVQGVGNVGANLCRLLAAEGARLTVTDVHAGSLEAVADEVGAETVAPAAIYGVDAEVFAPCAMGAVLNDETIPRLKAKVVSGAANNQLDEDRHGALLADAGITYLPDYVANGGGLVSCEAEWYRLDRQEVAVNVRKIHGTCKEILESAQTAGLPTSEAADAIAEDRFGGPKIDTSGP